MKLVYSDEAVADLVHLRKFIADHDPAVAARVARELIERIDHLRRFPEMGRRVEQAPDPEAVRDAVFGKYIVRYVVHGGSAAILRVWHHMQARGGDS